MTEQQKPCECPKAKALQRLIPFVEAYRVGPGSNEREYEFVGKELDAARAALASPCSCDPLPVSEIKEAI